MKVELQKGIGLNNQIIEINKNRITKSFKWVITIIFASAMCLKRRPLTYNQDRIIDIQVDVHPEKWISPFPSNFISTSRYTSYNFLPFSLLL